MHFRFNIDTKKTKNKNYNGNQTSTEEIQQMQRKPLRCKNTKKKKEATVMLQNVWDPIYVYVLKNT